jgi:hypothetical protein
MPSDSNYQVRWLNKQCDELKYKEATVLAKVLDEWLVPHSEEIIQAGNFDDLVGTALDEFINRHRDEFLPLDH